MSYFQNFPIVNYRFGDEVTPTIFQKLTAYVDIIDQVKNSSAFYTSYFIQQDERPDTLSYKLYDTVDYHWTFFLLNDHLRLSGWPLSNTALYKLSEQYYPHQSIVTKDPIFDSFVVGSRVEGLQSGATGVVIKRNLDLGQLIIDVENGLKFYDDEQVTYFDERTESIRSLQVYRATTQLFATHHFEDANGNPIDIDPFTQIISGLENVTYRDHLSRRNEELKKISVLKPSVINRVVGEFNASLRSN